MSMPEIRKVGIEAQLEKLGPEDTLSFIQQYNPGQGYYTAERYAWLDQLSLEEIEKSIRQRRDWASVELGAGTDIVECYCPQISPINAD
jgi:hypothetical protein